MISRREFFDSTPMLHQVMTAEQYERMVRKLEEMPDYEFEQFMAEAKHHAEHMTPPSPKEFWEMSEEVRRRNGATNENCAANRLPIQYRTEEGNRKLWDAIDRSKPSDEIVMKAEEDEFLCSFWRKTGAETGDVLPSDLFFAGNVALTDCIINIDERSIGGTICKCRVVIFQDYKERIQGSDVGEAIVGAIILTIRGGSLAVPIGVVEGFNGMTLGNAGWRGIPKEVRERSLKEITQQQVLDVVSVMMNTWYGIQIALIHPLIKDVFAHPKTAPAESARPGKSGKRKRVTRYIRRHIINKDDLERAAYGENRSYTRKTLCWYVIGHWRHYSNGNKVFIQPYWKGALREMKQNLDEGRDRIIAIPEGGRA